MPESYESMMIRLGFDAGEVKAGTDAMLGVQKRAALEYTALWQSAAEKKQAAEQAAAVKSFQLFEADLKKRVEARAASDALIAAGSIPEDFTGGASRNAQAAKGIGRGVEVVGDVENAAYAFDSAGKLIGKLGKDGKLIKGAEELAAGAGKAVHELHGSAGAMRELFVIIHEGLNLRFKQMFGSMLRLVSLIGGSSLMIGTGLVAAGLAAVVGPEAYRTYKAREGAKESEKDLKGRVDGQAEELRKRVEGLQKLGKINDIEGAGMLRSLKNPSADSVNSVYNQTDKFLKEGSVESQLAAQKEAAEVAKIKSSAAQEELAAARESMPILLRRQSLEIERHELFNQMGTMQKNSVEHARAELEIARLNRDINKENVELAKEKNELQKRLNEDREKIQDITMKSAAIDVSDAIPTIEDLAGRDYSASLASQYGPAKYVGRGRNRRRVGGEFDLSAGTGPFAGIARDAMLAKYQERYDIINGNAEFTDVRDDKGRVIGTNLTGGAAFEDRQRRIRSENLLRGAGLETPEMKQSKMAEDMARISADMTAIRNAATKDGIKLQDQ